MKPLPNPCSRGFTLVELAIIMTIIAILIGGVLQGRALLTKAKVRATTKQIESVRAAFLTFHDRYSQLPGDMVNALQRVPNCGPSTFCANGNGNAIIGPSPTPPSEVLDGSQLLFPFLAQLFLLQSSAGVNTREDLETVQAWKHLALADLISGVRPNADPLNDVAWGVTHPHSYFSGGLHLRSTVGGSYLIFRDTMMDVFDIDVPEDAEISYERVGEQLDDALDDGDPLAGDVSHLCVHAAGVGCFTVVKVF